MREIVKVLLEKGIDEETIHEVLNILETSEQRACAAFDERSKRFDETIADLEKKQNEAHKKGDKETRNAISQEIENAYAKHDKKLELYDNVAKRFKK